MARPKDPELWMKITDEYRAALVDGSEAGVWTARKAVLSQVQYRSLGGEWEADDLSAPLDPELWKAVREKHLVAKEGGEESGVWGKRKEILAVLEYGQRGGRFESSDTLTPLSSLSPGEDTTSSEET